MPKSDYEYVKIVKIDYTPKESVPEWYDKELITHIYGTNSNHEFVHLQVGDTKARIWTKQNPDDIEMEPEMRKHITEIRYNEAVTYSNKPEPLYTIYLDYPFMAAHSAYRDRGMRGYFDWTGQADVLFRDGVRLFYGWKDVIRIPRGKRYLSVDEISPVDESIHISTNDVMLDIEAFNDDGSFASGKHPTGIIYCWSVKNLRTGDIYHATILDIDKEKVMKCIRDGAFLYQNCTINKKKYKKDIIDPIKGDVHLYKLIEGDIEHREIKLIDALRIVLDTLGVNIIEGFNVDEFDVSYIRNRTNQMNRNIGKRGHSRYGSPMNYNKEYYPRIDFNRMMVFDLMEGYRSYKHKSSLLVEDKRVGLKWLGEEIVGYGKIKIPSMLELADNNPDMMSVYNIWDVELPARIEEELGVLPYYKDFCAFHGASLEHNGSMIFNAENLLMHELGCKEIFPSRKFVPRITMEKHGAFIDEASTGVHRNMIELDLSGQYPGAIMTGNLDIKTKVDERGDYPVVTFPSGRMYRTDIDGLVPMLMHRLREKRNLIRKRMKELDNDRENLEYKKCKQNQEIIKHAMASWSGGFGTVQGKTDFVSRFADNGIYNDITEVSRLLKKWNKGKIEGYHCIYGFNGKVVYWSGDETTISLGLGQLVQTNDGNALLKESVPIKLTVRYGDTDSTKCTIDNADELEKRMGREFTKDDLQIIGNHYAEMLNDSYKEFSKKYLGTDKHYFFVKMEEPIKSYFQWGKKKLYVELDFDDIRHDKGTATVRSDKGVLVKECMDYVLDRIIFGEMDKLPTYLGEIEKKIFSGKYTTELGTPQRIKVITNMWYPNLVYSNELFDDYNFKLFDKPVFFYLNKLHGKTLPKNRVVGFRYGDNPVDRGAVIDYEKHLNIIKQAMRGIFAGLNTTWDEIRDGIQKRDLGDVF